MRLFVWSAVIKAQHLSYNRCFFSLQCVLTCLMDPFICTKRVVDISGLILLHFPPGASWCSDSSLFTFYSSTKLTQNASLKKNMLVIDPRCFRHYPDSEWRLLRGNRALWIVHSVNVLMHFSEDSLQLPKSHHDLWCVQMKFYNVHLSLYLSYKTLKYIWY